MKTLAATDAKQNFAELISSVLKGPVEITRNNRRVAVVLSPEEYDALQAEHDRALASRASEAMKRSIGVEATDARIREILGSA